MRITSYCIIALLLLATVSVQAEIFRYIDKQGRLHFTDKPPPLADGKTPGLTVQKLSKPSHTTRVKIYKYVDANGVIHLTDEPPDNRYKLVYSGFVGSSLLNPERLKSNERVKLYADLIKEVAMHHGLDPALLHAVIRTESAYNPEAVSSKGAVGLMQLMPATARRFGVSDSTDPRENLNGGAQYLKLLLELFNDDKELALAAYNAGEGAVKKYNNTIPPYRETQHYVRRVLQLYQYYRGAL
jgi:soluble lytic murein transglycosylase-like protein